ncbi:MAG: universal stress protein [Deltaproteobacteria bacterium]|nr:universal stress protein [Deltaproteobacteria bacterium]
MTQLDHFESAFNAANKEVFHVDAVDLKQVFVITDLNKIESEAFAKEVKEFLEVVGHRNNVEWTLICSEDYDDVGSLLKRVLKEEPSLICTYRNLKNDEYAYPYSLGAYLNVLIRLANPPVLVLPHPRREHEYHWTEINTDRVMVVTDHLTGDERIVNWGMRFAETGGQLFLSHIEDDDVLNRYLDIIGKIPQLPTDIAVEKIGIQLLKEPADYIDSCKEAIAKKDVDLDVKAVVQMGHKISDYKKLVEEHQIDLLVLRSHDDAHEVAMHGMAYTLTVELVHLPMLLI